MTVGNDGSRIEAPQHHREAAGVDDVDARAQPRAGRRRPASRTRPSRRGAPGSMLTRGDRRPAPPACSSNSPATASRTRGFRSPSVAPRRSSADLDHRLARAADAPPARNCARRACRRRRRGWRARRRPVAAARSSDAQIDRVVVAQTGVQRARRRQAQRGCSVSQKCSVIGEMMPNRRDRRACAAVASPAGSSAPGPAPRPRRRRRRPDARRPERRGDARADLRGRQQRARARTSRRPPSASAR